MLWNILKSALRKAESAPSAPLADRVHELIKRGRLTEAAALVHDTGATQEVEEALRLALSGEVKYHLKDREGAEQDFKAALHLRPSLAEGHYGLSLIYYDDGRVEDALAHAQYARNVRPDSAPILAQCGLCYIAVQDYSNARDVLRQAALLDPSDAPTLNNLGIALHATGDAQGALYYFQRALSLRPDYPPALTNLRNLYGIDTPSIGFDPATGAAGTLMAANRQADRALPAEETEDIEALEARLEEDPKDVEASITLVERLLKALRLEEARDVLHLALAHHPAHVRLLGLAGTIAHQLGQYNQALANFQLALDQDAEDVDALLGMSQVLRDQGKVEDALGYAERAAAVRRSLPVLLQLAAAQANACRYEDCLTTCAEIEAAEPHLASALLTSRAVSYAYLGRFDEAAACVEQVRRQDPANIGLRCFMGIIDLQHERYAQGWEGYRYRFLMESNDQRLLPFPRWQGEPVEGKTVLVLAEQGLGDQVMFASCLPDLLALKPGKVLLEANARVAKTLARSFPMVQVITSGQNKHLDWYRTELEPDCYVHIADLPYHFRRRIEDFPAHTGYLVADPARVDYWRACLDEADTRPKIGLSWRGGLQKTRQRVRSLELAQLRPLLADPSVQFVNLQYGEVTDELQRFQDATGLAILHYPEAIADLDEFAALICALDLVVTVCNTTVHYAGALGRPAWVMAPHVPEWRYGLSGPGMRWYPSVRMFRQSAPGAWEEVVESVRQALADWLARPPP